MGVTYKARSRSILNIQLFDNLTQSSAHFGEAMYKEGQRHPCQENTEAASERVVAVAVVVIVFWHEIPSDTLQRHNGLYSFIQSVYMHVAVMWCTVSPLKHGRPYTLLTPHQERQGQGRNAGHSTDYSARDSAVCDARSDGRRGPDSLRMLTPQRGRLSRRRTTYEAAKTTKYAALLPPNSKFGWGSTVGCTSATRCNPVGTSHTLL